MPSQYLQPSDYNVYGLPTSTTDQQVIQASAMVDAYLLRPEGLVWAPDYLGQPCYMASLVPEMTVESQGTITAGSLVTVTLTNPIQVYEDMIGDVVILDRGSKSPSLVEACVISAIPGPGQLTLYKVANDHGANCTMDFGLTILEEREVSGKRSITRVARPPLRLISGMGRYGYGRRLDQTMGMYNEVNLLAAIQAFGGPPLWVPFDVTQASISRRTQEIWVPAGLLLQYYSEVRLRYVSGYPTSGIPAPIKAATAKLIMAMVANPELIGQLKSIGAGDTKIERFAPSQLDADTLKMLNNYRMAIII